MILRWFAGLCAICLCLASAPFGWATAPGAFRLHLAALALALAAGLAIQGARRGAVALAGLAALSLAIVAPTLRPTIDAGPGLAITLVSANLRRDNRDHDGLTRDLLALDADILVLQEIPPGLLETHPALLRAYPHGRAHFSPIPPSGRAVLSRLPLAPDGAPSRGGDQPGHAAASFQAGGAAIRVMSVHFDWPLIGAQAMQIDRFARFAKDFSPEHGAHTVLAGDFNAAAWSRGVAQVGAVAGAASVGGFLGTWRGAAPERLAGVLSALPFGAPLDHILLSPGLRLRATGTAPITGSDHLALRATLFIPAP